MNLRMFKDFTRAKKYLVGTLLINEGVCNDLYIVLNGEAGVFINYKKPNEQLVKTVVPGNLIGAKQFFMGKRSPFTVVVLKEMIAVTISRSEAASFIKDEPEISFEIMKMLYSRIDELETKYENKLKTTVAVKQNKEAGEADCPPLFPDGHGTYELTLNNEDREHLYEKSIDCPICRKSFKALAVRPSKLILEKSGECMREYYKDIEPLYYDILTCPNCLYSALSEMFINPDKSKLDIQRYLKPYKNAYAIKSGAERDTFSVFTGYYLALQCAPKSFINYQMAEAKLLLKLSRVYEDCEDNIMAAKTLGLALDAYLNVYEKVSVTPAQEQQLCLMLGEINLKMGETETAKNFFFKAKTNREGNPVYRDQADNRLFEIHEMENEHVK